MARLVHCFPVILLMLLGLVLGAEGGACACSCPTGEPGLESSLSPACFCHVKLGVSGSHACHDCRGGLAQQKWALVRTEVEVPSCGGALEGELGHSIEAGMAIGDLTITIPSSPCCVDGQWRMMPMLL